MKYRKFTDRIITFVLIFVMVVTPMLSTADFAVAESVKENQPVEEVQEETPGEIQEEVSEEVPEEGQDEPQEEAEKESPEEAQAEVPQKTETPETAESPAEAESPAKTEYDFEDKQIKVSAELSKASIIPDDAEFIVTRIDKDTEGYNYDAYMEALNKQDKSEQYTDFNTILYDFAFIKDGKELQPEEGTVSVNVEFKNSQLTKKLGADKASDIKVTHLPLKDSVRESVDTTKEATDIKAKDINTETLNDAEVKIKGEQEATFELGDFSGVAFSVPDDSMTPVEGAYKTVIKFVDPYDNPVQAASIGNYYVLMKQGNAYYVDLIQPNNQTAYYASTKEFTNPDAIYGAKISYDPEKATEAAVISVNNKGSFHNWETLDSQNPVRYNVGDTVGDYVVDSIDSSTVGITVITLKEKPCYTVKVNLVDFDGSTPYDDGVTQGNYFIRVKATGADGKVYYAVKPVTLNGTSTATVAVKGFIELTDPDYESMDDRKFNNQTTPDTIEYDPATMTIDRSDVRLINNSNGEIFNDRTAFLADDIVEGFVFKGNIQDKSTHTSTITLRHCETKYDIRLVFEPNRTAVAENDYYYLFVEVEHQSTGKTYYYQHLSFTKQDITEEDGQLFYNISIPRWMNGNGNLISDKFTGNEDAIKVHLLKANKDVNLNTVVNNMDNPNREFVVLDDGDLFNGYVIRHGARVKKEKASEAAVHYYDVVELKQSSLSNDYDYKSILGPGVNYGITADRMEQKTHDVQSNFATNNYAGNDAPVNPNLSGDSAGGVAIGNYVRFTDDNDKTQYEIDPDGKVRLSDSNGHTVVVYTDKEDRIKRDSGTVTQFIPTSPEDVAEYIVEPIIAHMKSVSDELLMHDADLEPFTLGGVVIVDTTEFDDGETIYIDGDLLAQNYPNIFQDGGDEKLKIKKKQNQTIVFNFKDTEELYHNRYSVELLTENPDGTVTTVTGNSAPDTSHGSEQNKIVDNISRHIVWNMKAASKIRFHATAGMFLIQNPSSDARTVNTASTGWIITDGYFCNEGGEWHFVYSDLKDVDTAEINAYKKVNGVNASTDQKFNFAFDRFVDGEYIPITTAVNNGSSAFAEISYENMSQGENIFRITETGIADAEGAFEENTQEYFVSVYYYIVNNTNIVGIPHYYNKFDPETRKLSEPIKLNQVVFENKSDRGNLAIQKQVSGGTDTESHFRFEIHLEYKQNNVVKPVSGLFEAIVSQDGQEDVSKMVQFRTGVGYIDLMAGQTMTIKNLPAGADYRIKEETIPAGYVLKSSENAAGSISKDKASNVVFVNAKTGALKVKKIVSSSYSEDFEKDFSFKIILDDKTINGTHGDLEFVDGVAEFTLKDEDSATASDIPVGTAYTVVENNEAIYSKTVTGDVEGEISNETKNVTFTNSRIDEGDLSVKKIVQNGTSGDNVKPFTFKIGLGKISGKFGDVTFTNNEATITTEQGKTISAKGLPDHIKYTITTEEDGIAGKTYGDMTFDQNGKYEFTSTDGTIKLADNLPSHVEFKIQLSITGQYGDIYFKDGKAYASSEATVEGITLKHNETKTAQNLPAGITYTVTEDPETGFTTAATGASGEIGDNTQAQFINTKTTEETGSVQVKKVFSGVDALPDGFQITNDYNSDVFTVANKTSGSGKASDPYVWTIENVPVGTQITFTERGAGIENYELAATASPEDGKSAAVVKDGTATVVLTNTYTQDTGNVEVKKVFSGASALPADFQITNDYNSDVFTVSNKTSGSGTEADPYVWRITGVPVGTQVTFTESGADIPNYALVATASPEDGKSAAVVKDQTKEVVLTNTYTQDTGNVEVKKVFSGASALPADFQITNDYNSDVFTVSNKTSGSGTEADPYVWRITGVPVGTQVTFTESGADIPNYALVATASPENRKSAAVVKDGTATVVLTNTYTQDTGNVEVKKVFSGASALPADFQITNDYNSDVFTVSNKTSGSGTEADPYVWRITGVPVGTQVTFTESGADIPNYALVATASPEDGKSAAVVKDGTATVVLTNTYTQDKGGLKVTKAVTGTTTDKTFKFTVKNAAGDYIKVDGTTSTTEVQHSITNGGSVEITNLPVGTYTVTELGTEEGGSAQIAGYSLVPSGGGAVEVKKNSEAKADLTNTYTKDTAKLKVKKSFYGAKALTDDEKKAISFTVKGPNGFTETTKTYAEFDSDGVWDLGTVLPGTYTVTENNAGKSGYTLATTYWVDGDRAEEGKVTLVKSDDPVEIELINTYTKYADVDAVFSVSKQLTGIVGSTQPFEFKMEPVNDNARTIANSLQTVEVTGTGSKDFSKLVFSEAGEYVFKFYETQGSATGYTYDKSEYQATVNVTDTGEAFDKTITIVKTKDAEGKAVNERVSDMTVAFTNTYKAGATSHQFQIRKAVAGITGSDKTFKFNIIPISDDARDSKKAVNYNEPGEVQIEGAGPASFNSITFKEPGTYEYTLSEVPGTDKGYTYDKSVYKAVVEVTDNKSGTLQKTVTVKKTFDANGTAIPEEQQTPLSDDAVIEYVNNYKAEAAEDQFEISKKVTGRTSSTKTFNFVLMPDDDNAKRAMGNLDGVFRDVKGEGSVQFSRVTFDEAGDYVFIVKEIPGEDDGYTYDKSVFQIKVTATDDGSGEIKTTKVITRVFDKDGKRVEEPVSDMKIEFVNDYQAEETDAQFTVSKKTTGTTGSSKTFEFVIKPVSADARNAEKADKYTSEGTVSVTGAGDKAFDMITYSKVGTYEYEISEKKGDAKGYDYDQSVYKAVVEVTDNETGKLQKEVEVTKIKDADGNDIAEENQVKTDKLTVDYDNEYQAEAAMVGFGIQKELKDPESTTDKEFTFRLEAADEDSEAVLETPDIKSVKGAGRVDFDVIGFDKVGTYTFKITEDEKDYNDFKFDKSEYTAVVKITDNDSGELQQDVKVTKTKDEEGAEIAEPEEVDDLTVTFTNEKLSAELRLTKEIDKYFDAGDKTNATMVFTVSYEEDGKTVERNINVKYDAESDTAQTAVLEDIPLDAEITVKETYSGNYKPDDKVKTLTMDDLKQDEDGKYYYAVSFMNRLVGTNSEKGIINKYSKDADGSFVIKERVGADD